MSILSNYEYFTQYPEKVLGIQQTTKSRFGDPVTTFVATPQGLAADLKKLAEGLPMCRTALISPSTTVIQNPANPLMPTPSELANVQKSIKKSIKKTPLGGSPNKEVEVWDFDEVDRRYNAHLTKEQKQAFVYWQINSLIRPMEGGWRKYHIGSNDEVAKLIRAKTLYHDGKKFVPTFILEANDVYDTHDNLKKNRIFATREYIRVGLSQVEAENQYKESIERVAAKIKEGEERAKMIFKEHLSQERALKLDPTSAFVRNMDILDQRGIRTNILAAYQNWLMQNSQVIKLSNFTDIRELAIEGRRAGRGEEGYDEKRARAREEMLRLFPVFIFDGLSDESRRFIEDQFHIKYNSTIEPDLNQVPIGFSVASSYNDNPMDIRIEKREAIAKAMLAGSLCIAYGVGLGKTWCAAFVMAQFMENGWAKRPLLTVPLQVYNQFVRELQGLLPKIEVVTLSNLNSDYIRKAKQSAGNKERAIFVCTHQGFTKLGISEAYYDEFEQSMRFVRPVSKYKKTAAEEKKEENQFLKRLGASIQGAEINIDELGIDFLAMDEAHAAKKIFTEIKETAESRDESKKRETPKYRNIGGAAPSQFGLRTFILSNYIQQRNPTSNVLLLTATPFTNSPLEIYSFLMVLASKYLKANNLINMEEFYDTFADIRNELTITASLEALRKDVFIGFKQLPALQKIIQRFFLYRYVAQDLNRPNKIIFPSREAIIDGRAKSTAQSVGSYLMPTEYQEAAIALAKQELNDIKNSTSAAFSNALLGAMVVLRLVSLSPYLIKRYDYLEGLPELTYKSFVETSSKLDYVMRCIKSVRTYCISNKLPMAGQIIYMPVGIEYYPLLKKYLVREVGFASWEVAYITGQMQPHEGSKSQVQDKFLGRHFNVKTQEFERIPDIYRVKVLIGSDSITEGLNLQTMGAVVYNCFLDWNPTDSIQLEGRIWRQGNLYKNVRIVYPLVLNSMDAFIYQKVEEKTKRINAIWDYSGNASAVDLSDYDPQEVKYELISDISILLNIELENELSLAEQELAVAEGSTRAVKDQEKQSLLKLAMGYLSQMQDAVNFFNPDYTGEYQNSRAIQGTFWLFSIGDSKLDTADWLPIPLIDKQKSEMRAVLANVSKLPIYEQFRAVQKQMRTFFGEWNQLALSTEKYREAEDLSIEAPEYLVDENKAKSIDYTLRLSEWLKSYNNAPSYFEPYYTKINAELQKAKEQGYGEGVEALKLMQVKVQSQVDSLRLKLAKIALRKGDTRYGSLDKYADTIEAAPDFSPKNVDAADISDSARANLKADTSFMSQRPAFKNARIETAEQMQRISRKQAKLLISGKGQIREAVQQFEEYNPTLSDLVKPPQPCGWGEGKKPKGGIYTKYKVQIDADGNNKTVEVLNIFGRNHCEPMYRIRYASGFEDFAVESEFAAIPIHKPLKGAKLQDFISQIHSKTQEIEARLGEFNLEVIESQLQNDGAYKLRYFQLMSDDDVLARFGLMQRIFRHSPADSVIELTTKYSQNLQVPSMPELADDDSKGESNNTVRLELEWARKMAQAADNILHEIKINELPAAGQYLRGNAPILEWLRERCKTYPQNRFYHELIYLIGGGFKIKAATIRASGEITLEDYYVSDVIRLTLTAAVRNEIANV